MADMEKYLKHHNPPTSTDGKKGRPSVIPEEPSPPNVRLRERDSNDKKRRKNSKIKKERRKSNPVQKSAIPDVTTPPCERISEDVFRPRSKSYSGREVKVYSDKKNSPMVQHGQNQSASFEEYLAEGKKYPIEGGSLHRRLSKASSLNRSVGHGGSLPRQTSQLQMIHQVIHFWCIHPPLKILER